MRAASFAPGRVAVFQRGDVFQNVGAGAIGPGLALFAAGDLQAVEQDLAQLLGAAHVELFARDGLDFLLKLHQLSGQRRWTCAPGVAVDLDAGHLHVGQHGTSGRSRVS
jgi:hypothetical protein